MAWANSVRLLVACCALVYRAAALADPCPPPPDPRSDPAKRLLLAGKADLNSLDPYARNDNFTLGLLGNVYEGLVRRKPTGELVGALAKDWKKVDDTHWRFYLRQDVEIVLSAPIPGLVAEWDSWYMMSKPWIETSESADPSRFDSQHGLAAMQANGTGPFIVTTFKPGERTEFAPNPNWWVGTAQKFDLVEFCPMPLNADRVDALLSSGTDRVDWIDAVAPRDWQRVVQNFNTKGVISDDFQIVFLGFDVARDKLTGQNQTNPFKEPDVRKAIYQAIDVDFIRSNIMRNRSIPASSLVASAVFAPAAGIQRLKYDLNAAKALLAATSYPDGFEVGLDCPMGRFTNDADICDSVKDMLFSIGITVTVNKQSWEEFTAKVLAGGGYGTSFYLFGWAPGSLDALNVLTNLLTCRDEKAGKGLYNIGGYCNPAVDDLVGKIKLANDTDKRNDLMLQALQLVHQDIPVVPLHQQMALKGLSKALNVVERRDGRVSFGEFDKH